MTRNQAVSLILRSTSNHCALLSRLPTFGLEETLFRSSGTSRQWCRKILMCCNDEILLALLPARYPSKE